MPTSHRSARPGADDLRLGPPADAYRRGLLAYVWSGPTTALGLALGALTLFTGGSVERRDGTLEFRGALSRAMLESRFLTAGAITLGHVILGRDRRNLDACRAHEHGHVRQAELLGPLFLPAYGIASLWAALRHRDPYRANWFERDAVRRSAQAAHSDADPPQDRRPAETDRRAL